MPNVVVFGGEIFGGLLGHESGPLMNGICALKKGTPESTLAPFTI